MFRMAHATLGKPSPMRCVPRFLGISSQSRVAGANTREPMPDRASLVRNPTSVLGFLLRASARCHFRARRTSGRCRRSRGLDRADKRTGIIIIDRVNRGTAEPQGGGEDGEGENFRFHLTLPRFIFLSAFLLSSPDVFARSAWQQQIKSN